jgi:hypothetical protein
MATEPEEQEIPAPAESASSHDLPRGNVDTMIRQTSAEVPEEDRMRHAVSFFDPYMLVR